ncbi:hypothetical protein F4776DRAFT_529739 [Hypoxylon sp. NC0597]|nr:hypothetical protein F4776DRAFT_529739 [Hypoxylon sp. NC0597]
MMRAVAIADTFRYVGAYICDAFSSMGPCAVTNAPGIKIFGSSNELPSALVIGAMSDQSSAIHICMLGVKCATASILHPFFWVKRRIQRLIIRWSR